ncbi:MAG: MarR family winged helix-turn-helix transcriptional regulator [Bacteroidia bacterium]
MKIDEAIKQKKFDSPVHKAMVNVIYTYNWLSNLWTAFFEQYEITEQQYNVLRILRGRYPNSICAGDIKEVMLDKNPDLTRLCDRLVKKGLIERQYNEFNRRQVLIRITKTGLDLLRHIDPGMKKQAKKIKLSDKEAELLSDLLDKIRG